MKKNKFAIGLGLFSDSESTTLFYRKKNQNKIETAVNEKDSLEFEKNRANLRFASVVKIDQIRASQINDQCWLTVLSDSEKGPELYTAQLSRNLSLRNLCQLKNVDSLGMIVPNYQYQGKKVIYFGKRNLQIGFSKDLADWEIESRPVFEIREEILGRDRIKIGQIIKTKFGIAVVCFKFDQELSWESYSFQVIMLDKDNPRKLIWSKSFPVLGQLPNQKVNSVIPFGLTLNGANLTSYWNLNNQQIFALNQPFIDLTKPEFTTIVGQKLIKSNKNPIIKPKSERSWEAKQVFNPAAVYDKGKVHLVYRAIGKDDVSSLGYANSENGVDVDHRSDKPIYFPSASFETNDLAPKVTYKSYSSGWGVGGCEDPKITKIGNRYYMTYTAWDGNSPPRVALTSISVKDFIACRWNWAKPVLISPPGKINKNWSIFPKKVKGKYAILHSISPKILIDYFDDLDFDGKTYIDSFYQPSGRKNHWDNWVRGVGPPPIETKIGWLILYHAMDKNDSGKYKLGAMILDKNDPSKILFRSRAPLLIPDKDYENTGFKPGVVYSCGAVVKDGRLLVYYGGADNVVCLAQIKLNNLLDDLKFGKGVIMNKVSFSEPGHFLA